MYKGKDIKMIKKLLLVSALALPLTISKEVKSFEFPEKLPYGDVSANVSYYSQYVWRGDLQNAGQSAILGGLDYGVTLLDTYIDFYAGIWGSNVSGATNSVSGNELDYYGGFSGAVPFLEGVKQRFGLTDFRVILDGTTTTPDLIDRNIMYAKVLLKPARAIEFIAVDFVITRTGASFDD